jgi:hypothetical protein
MHRKKNIGVLIMRRFLQKLVMFAFIALALESVVIRAMSMEEQELFTACKKNDLEMVKSLVEEGVKPSAGSITPCKLAGEVQIKAYLELVEDFYAVNEAKKTFTDFTKKYLGNYELIPANMTDIVNLLPLANVTFGKQLMTLTEEIFGEKEMRWLFLKFAEKATGEKMLYWLRETFKYLDGENKPLYQTFSDFDTAVLNAIDKLPSLKDRDQLTKEKNKVLQQKKQSEAIAKKPEQKNSLIPK